MSNTALKVNKLSFLWNPNVLIFVPVFDDVVGLNRWKEMQTGAA